jgi:hypothetical protein
VVQDEPGTGDTYVFDPVSGTLQVDWMWLICCTDGVAIGGLEGQSFTITITPSFGIADGGTITTMEFAWGDIRDLQLILLDLTAPFTIETTGEPFSAHQETLAVTKALLPESPRLSWRDNDRVPVAIDPNQSVVAALPECIAADGATTSWATVDLRDGAGDPLGSGISVSFDSGDIWPGQYTGPTFDRINGRYQAPVVSDTLGEGTLSVTAEGVPLVDTKIVKFVASVPEADFLHDAPQPSGFPVCFQSTTSGGALPYQLSWDLDGDWAEDSTAPAPCHVYPAPGRYYARLEVLDARGCKSSKALPIDITP